MFLCKVYLTGLYSLKAHVNFTGVFFSLKRLTTESHQNNESLLTQDFCQIIVGKVGSTELILILKYILLPKIFLYKVYLITGLYSLKAHVNFTGVFSAKKTYRLAQK